MKRTVILGLMFAAFFLSGCKEPQSQPGDGFIRAGQDVVIKSVQIYPAAENAAYSIDQYYVITFNFTNHLGIALAPKLDHFAISDRTNTRYLGMTSGSTALVGITNSDAILKVGENHDYTVGFRVPRNTFGTLLYDATF